MAKFDTTDTVSVRKITKVEFKPTTPAPEPVPETVPKKVEAPVFKPVVPKPAQKPVKPTEDKKKSPSPRCLQHLLCQVQKCF